MRQDSLELYKFQKHVLMIRDIDYTILIVILPATLPTQKLTHYTHQFQKNGTKYSTRRQITKRSRTDDYFSETRETWRSSKTPRIPGILNRVIILRPELSSEKRLRFIFYEWFCFRSKSDDTGPKEHRWCNNVTAIKRIKITGPKGFYVWLGLVLVLGKRQ